MVQVLPMSTSLREEMLRYVPRTDDPEIRARQRHVARVLLDMDPELRAELVEEGRKEGRKEGLKEARKENLKKAIDKGRLLQARIVLPRVLAMRQLPLSAKDEARIEACTDIETLRRWLDQAVVASSAADALVGSAAP